MLFRSERFASSVNESAGNRTPRDASGEVNGNSRSYTKDTDMQFARELSKGFGGKSNGDRASSDRGSVAKPYARRPEGGFGTHPSRSDGGRNESRSSTPRSDSPRANTGEKFGNPRPQRSNDRPASGSTRSAGDSTPRRPRSFV